MNPFEIKTISFPAAFRPDLTFLIGLPAFTLAGAYGWYFIFSRIHNYGLLTIVTALFLILAAFAVIAFSYRLRIDDEGFHFSWLFGSRTVAWADVDRMEKTAQGYAVHGKTQTDLLPLSVLSTYAQKAIADEVVARLRFKAETKKQKYPVLELWSR